MGRFKTGMKKTIENNETLIKQLALEGDSHAFFLLGESYFRMRYQKERINGATHQDAQMRIIADATELLEGLQHVAPVRFDAWLDEHCTMSTGSPSDPNTEAVSDKKIAAETDAFLNRCSNELIRTGSLLKKARRLKERSFPYLLFRNKIAMILWITVGSLAFLFAAGLLMAKTSTALVVSLDTPGGQFSVQFPPLVMNDEPAVSSPLPVATPENVDTSENILPDSLRQKDVAQAGLLPQKQKKAGPRPVTEKKSLPPVVPRARLVLPPPPPPCG